MYKEEKGITLIALIVTIIVLIILAAVTIVALTGDNNILDDAQLAKVSNAYRCIEDQVKLAYMAAYSHSEIQTALDSNYDLTLGTNAIKVAQIIKKDLADDSFEIAFDGEKDAIDVPQADGTTLKESKVTAIYVKSTNGQVQAGKIDTNVPKNDGVVYTKITLEKQKITYEFDVEKPATPTLKDFSKTVPASF